MWFTQGWCASMPCYFSVHVVPTLEDALMRVLIVVLIGLAGMYDLAVAE